MPYTRVYTAKQLKRRIKCLTVLDLEASLRVTLIALVLKHFGFKSLYTLKISFVLQVILCLLICTILIVKLELEIFTN